MFGIGIGELMFILMIVLLLFGSDKIPDVARGLARGISQVKNATNEIKSEITKSVNETGVVKDIKDSINVDEIKERFGYDDLKDSMNMDHFNPLNDVQQEIEKAKEDIETMTGPIKRMK